MATTSRPFARMSGSHTFSVGMDAFVFSIIIGVFPGLLIGLGQSIHDSQEQIAWALYILAAILFLCGLVGLWTKFAADAISIGIALNKKYTTGNSPPPDTMNLIECFKAGFDTIGYVITFILTSSFFLIVGTTLQDSEINDLTSGFVSQALVFFSFGVFFVGVIGLRTKVLADAISAGLSMEAKSKF
ncbi:MAG: hypothetical protein VXY10_01860 [Candidatus Thermoplasmatota archaeon]|nr:hypothetical protein [Candidatus Thermoplasmatota archaeon]MEC8708483.1 hypothetical protein [Candidatus Thermoplasmatota archaeon]